MLPTLFPELNPVFKCAIRIKATQQELPDHPFDCRMNTLAFKTNTQCRKG